MAAAKTPDEARAAVKGLLGKLGDKYTRYVAPDDYAALVVTGRVELGPFEGSSTRAGDT